MTETQTLCTDACSNNTISRSDKNIEMPPIAVAMAAFPLAIRGEQNWPRPT